MNSCPLRWNKAAITDPSGLPAAAAPVSLYRETFPILDFLPLQHYYQTKGMVLSFCMMVSFVVNS
jgi:hypothetical protein